MNAGDTDLHRRHSREVITVFGATGQQGGSVARTLRAAGWRVRAVVRDESAPAARALRSGGIETVSGDFADAASIGAALTGAHGVFSVQPSSGVPGSSMSDDDEVAAGILVADLAHAADVEHLVYSSAMALGDDDSGIGHFESKRRIENHIATMDLASTVIRPATFMEMIPVPARTGTDDHIDFLMAADQKMQFIAVRDIGLVVAEVFGAPDLYRGRTLDIAGDELTGDETAACVSAFLGRPITYRRIEPAGDVLVARLEKAVDEGRLSTVDLTSLRRQFPFLLDFSQWLDVNDAE